MDRRHFVRSLLLGGAGASAWGLTQRVVAAEVEPDEAELVTPGEDLMREHGLLERLLLLYEEADRRGQRGRTPWALVGSAADIIKRFIEDYHERLEEQYVFPALQSAGRDVGLVRTLLTQHERGRQVTGRIMALAAQRPRQWDEAGRLIHSFIRMYRPHYAREDTVIFPDFAKTLKPADYRELGDKFEEREHQLFGEEGFEGMVRKVAALEASVGLADLNQFTPQV